MYLEVDGDCQLFCPLDVSDELLGLQRNRDGGVDNHFQWKLKEMSSVRRLLFKTCYLRWEIFHVRVGKLDDDNPLLTDGSFQC